MKLLVTKTFLCRNIFLLNQYYLFVIHILKDWITIDNWMNIYIYIRILQCFTCHNSTFNGKFNYIMFSLLFRKWLTNPVRKLSTNKLERGPGPGFDGQKGDYIERQSIGSLGVGVSRVSCSLYNPNSCYLIVRVKWRTVTIYEISLQLRQFCV